MLINCCECLPGCPVGIPDVPAEKRFALFFDDSMASDTCNSRTTSDIFGPVKMISSCNRQAWTHTPPAAYIAQVGFTALTSAADPTMTFDKAPYLYLIFEDDRAAYYYASIITSTWYVADFNGCSCLNTICVHLTFPKDGNSPVAAIHNVTFAGHPMGTPGVPKGPSSYGLLDYFHESAGVKTSPWFNQQIQIISHRAVYSCVAANRRDLETDIRHVGTEDYDFGRVKDVRNTSATVTFSGGTGLFAMMNGSHTMTFVNSVAQIPGQPTAANFFVHNYTTSGVSFSNKPDGWQAETGNTYASELRLTTGGHTIAYDQVTETWVHESNPDYGASGIAPNVSEFVFHESPTPQSHWNMVASGFASQCLADTLPTWNATGGGCQLWKYQLGAALAAAL